MNPSMKIELKYNVALIVSLWFVSAVAYWLPYWGIVPVMGSPLVFAICTYVSAMLCGLYAKRKVDLLVYSEQDGIGRFETASLNAQVGDRVDNLFIFGFGRMLLIASLVLIPVLSDIFSTYIRTMTGMYYRGYNWRYSILTIGVSASLGYLICIWRFNVFKRDN